MNSKPPINYKKILKFYPDPVHIWQKIGNDLVFIDYNEAADRLVGGALKHIIGVKASKYFKERPQILKDLTQCLESKKTINRFIEHKFIASDITKFLKISYIFVPPDIVLGYHQDITSARIAERKLEESEKKFKTLAENVNIAIAIHNNGKMIDVNQTFSDLVGYTKTEIIGRNPLDFIAHEYRDEVLEKMRKQFQGTYESYALRKDETIFPIEIQGKEVMFKGEMVRVVSIKDITEKKRNQEKIRTSELKYRNLFERSPYAIWLMNLEGDIIDCNPATENLHAIYKVEDIIGKKFTDVLSLYDNAEYFIGLFKKRFNRYLEGQSPKPLEFQIRRGDGKMLWLNIQSSIIKIEDKPLIQIIIQDITDRKNAEEQLKNYTEELEKKVEERTKVLKESEERYRSLIDGANVGLWVIDGATNTQLVNPKLCEMLGYESDEMIGKSFLNFMDDKNKKIAIKKFDLRRQGEEEEHPFTFKHKNGENIYTMLKASPLFSKEGEFKGAMAFVANITEKKKVENALARERERLFLLLNSLPAFVFLESPDHSIQFANKYFEEKFGEDTTKKCYQLLTNKDHPCENCATMEVFKTGKPIVREWKRSESEIYQLYDYPFKDTDGSPLVLELGIEITELKKVEEELILSNKEFERTYHQSKFYKDLFSHDMSNIFQSITSSMDLLQMICSDVKDSSEVFQIMDQQIQRGKKLIENVQRLSEVEEKDQILKILDLNSYVLDSVKYIRSSFPNMDLIINIKSHFEEQKPFIRANELLSDVIENLLINAIIYNENSPVKIDIILSKIIEDEEEYLKLEVIDNAIGIEENRKQKIFLQKREHDSQSKGMGLGLSLITKIIDLYEGKIWVEDRVKGDHTKGSKFSLLFHYIPK